MVSCLKHEHVKMRYVDGHLDNLTHYSEKCGEKKSFSRGQ